MPRCAQIRKLDGGANRINIDDISITDFSSGGGGGGSGAALSKHTTLGIPKAASTSDPNNFLSIKSEYVISYNGSRKVPQLGVRNPDEFRTALIVISRRSPWRGTCSAWRHELAAQRPLAARAGARAGRPA